MGKMEGVDTRKTVSATEGHLGYGGRMRTRHGWSTVVLVAICVASFACSSTADPTTSIVSPSSSTLPATTTSPTPPETLPPTTVTPASTAPTVVTVTSTTLTAGLNGTVIDVTDGDSIIVRLASGQEEEVRLIGIDAPETGEEFAQEARAALAELVDSNVVTLTTDVEERDQMAGFLLTSGPVTQSQRA